MTDLGSIVSSAGAYAWLYLPVAIVLGAFHALEPGHAKSLMAGYIIAIKGSARQAVLLGISATVGHTIIIWGLAIAALAFGQRYIAEDAEPWLTAISGILIVLLALRMYWGLRRGHGHSHALPSHGHEHDHGHGSQTHRDHSHGDIRADQVSDRQVIWFGFTGGLMPCPTALAVLLVCIQLKAFVLGVAMVAAFSVGVGATLVTIGLAVVWSRSRLANKWPGFERAAARLPYLSTAIVLLIGVVMTAAGLNAAGVFSARSKS
jgi:nickel/cobalt exporter